MTKQFFFSKQKHKHVFTISIIPPHWHDTGSWNPSSCKTKSCLFHIANIMAADDLATQGTWAPSQYLIRRLYVRSRKVSKPRDWYFKLSYRLEIWQAHRQHCCRSGCQIAERSDNSKYKSRGFETLRDLTERRLFGYWDGAQGFSSYDIDLINRDSSAPKLRVKIKVNKQGFSNMGSDWLWLCCQPIKCQDWKSLLTFVDI